MSHTIYLASPYGFSEQWKRLLLPEFVDALDEIKKEGLINLIGASNWELSRFSAARDYAQLNNKEPFTVLSNNFSLAEMIDPVWPGCVGINND